MWLQIPVREDEAATAKVHWCAAWFLCMMYSTPRTGTIRGGAMRDEHHAEPDGLSVHEPLTVGALLADPALRAARVLTGQVRLASPVAWCLPWSEVWPGTARIEAVAVHVRIAELAGTTDLPAVLATLAARGAAALLISGDARPLRLDPVDSGGCDLPVIQLPATASFAQTNRLIAERTLAQAAHVLEYGVTVHRVLADLLHRGAGLPALGRQLARLSGCPAFILDPQGSVLAYEYLGVAAVPDPSEVVRLLREIDLTSLPPGPATGAPDASGSAPRACVVTLRLEDQTVTCVVGPIVLARRHFGTLVVVELDEPPAPHDLARHRVIVEQAATITGSELMRLRSVDEAMERARGDFVHALLHGRFANPHDLVARAAHHDFDIDARYAVVTAHGFDPPGHRPPAYASPQTPLSPLSPGRRAEQVLRRADARTLGTVVDDVLVVIREVPAASGQRPDRAGGVALVAEYATALARELERQSGRRPTVTYGRPASGARGISGSYREARIALQVCERLQITEVSGYPELRVFATLADVAASPQGRAFAAEVLTPLRRDGPGGDLERTVLAYLSSGGNLNAAARSLQLHRNTMLYKLDRAARLLGVDLREADNQFMVWLAHRIDLLSEAQIAVDQQFRPDP
jgi:sugar diacid utilization regulator